jgi:3-isopropylmalate/(R)-2-methylmalate dehydratase small subunit
MHDTKRITLTGTGIVLRGNDIDTDRIIPARYLRTVVFDGLGEHAFEDDRAQLNRTGQQHSFDNPKFRDAELLFVNKNFGCGSSREHAPQAIKRWGRGVKALVGESFAEIFFGNCVSLGMPCAVVSAANIERAMTAIEKAPQTSVTMDIRDKKITLGDLDIPFEMVEGVRQQFLDGRWDTTAELLANKAAIVAAAKKLPYFDSWS